MTSQDQLRAIHAHFTALVAERAAEFQARMPPEGVPPLTEDLLGRTEPEWLPVPGIYGGFAYRLVKEGDTYGLRADSWCRIMEGSGRAHEITVEGTRYLGELGV
jgi:hypothetical protein